MEDQEFIQLFDSPLDAEFWAIIAENYTAWEVEAWETWAEACEKSVSW